MAGYSIARYGTATGGTRVAATGGCSAAIAGLSCVEAAFRRGPGTTL